MRGRMQISLNIPDVAIRNEAAHPTIACIIPAWSFSSSLLGWETWSLQRTTGSSLCLSSFWFSMSSLRISSCSTCLSHWWEKLWAKLHRRARASGNSRYIGSMRLSKKEGVGNHKKIQRESVEVDVYIIYIIGHCFFLIPPNSSPLKKYFDFFSVYIWCFFWADVPSVAHMFGI